MKSQELIELQHDLLQNLARNLPLIGMRCPMIGKAPDDFTWDYPEADGYFWTDSFFTGELWLAYMLTLRSPSKQDSALLFFRAVLDQAEASDCLRLPW